jgi:hypothetical protein
MGAARMGSLDEPSAEISPRYLRTTSHCPDLRFAAELAKLNPGQSMPPGVCELLPQLAGFYDTGGFGVSGDGGCRSGLGLSV